MNADDCFLFDSEMFFPYLFFNMNMIKILSVQSSSGTYCKSFREHCDKDTLQWAMSFNPDYLRGEALKSSCMLINWKILFLYLQRDCYLLSTCSAWHSYELMVVFFLFVADACFEFVLYQVNDLSIFYLKINFIQHHFNFYNVWIYHIAFCNKKNRSTLLSRVLLLVCY